MATQTVQADQATLGSDIGDRLFLRSDEGYEAARTGRIWHGRHPDRRPEAILLASTEADIILGVRFARERGWSVAVRAGGHSFPVWSLRDEGLLIDLGGYKDMTYDPVTQIATATPAVQGGHELNPFLNERGRWFAAGGCPSVGLGGFLLQGGIGWNFRSWGYACEQVVAIDVVTADGELVRADENENADLFWAARGGGPGFFGLITRFHLRTRPMQHGLAFSMQAYPVERYADVLRWIWAKEPDISERVYMNALSVRPPMEIPGHDGGPAFVIWGVAFCDTVEESREALAPLQECPYLSEAILSVDTQPTSMPEQYAMVDAMHPEGPRYRVDSSWVEGSREEAIDAMRSLIVERQEEDCGYTFVIFKRPRPDAPDMAAKLETDLMIGAYVIYDDAGDDQKLKEWLEGAMCRLEPFTAGQYWGDSDQQFREVKCLTDESWQRFQGVRAQWDPAGLFHAHLAGTTAFSNRNHWQA